MRDRKEDNLVRRRLWLEQCAWANRRTRTMTPSELRLWSALSGRKLGVQFRREVPLAGRYIVDFCAPSRRLVVEVDGEEWPANPRVHIEVAQRGIQLLVPAI
jgi:very-short-patch-repair endonuclease